MCWLNLENACISHGQLYVARFRVGQTKNVFDFAKDVKPTIIVYSIIPKKNFFNSF